jgi:hypothetical protein
MGPETEVTPMRRRQDRRLLGGALILLLHLPLIALALWLYPQLTPSQSILELSPFKLLSLLLLAGLPYVVLNGLMPGWNPERARLGECEP